MKFSNDPKAPTDIIVRRHKIGRMPPAEWWDDGIEAELRRGHNLWNKLVEIDRGFDARRAALIGEDAAVSAAQEAHDAARAEYLLWSERRRHHRQQERSRAVPGEIKEGLARARAGLAQAKAGLRARQQDSKDAVKAQLAALENERQRTVAAARRASGVYWATANAIVQKFWTARAAVIDKRKAGRAAELHFRRWQGGRIVNQFTDGGLSLAAHRARLVADGIEIVACSEQTGAPREIRRTRKGKEEVVQWRPPGEQKRVVVPLAGARDAPAALPEIDGLRVKTIELTLRRNPDWHPLMPAHKRRLRARDQSSLVVTATAPPGSSTLRVPAREDVVAVNLGWRLLDDGALRVATILGEAYPEPEFVLLPPAWRALAAKAEALRGERDRALDAVRPKVRALPWPAAPNPELAEFGARLARAPKFGQRVLAQLVVRWRMTASAWQPAALAQIEEWRQADNELRSCQQAAERRFHGRRRDHYRCAAKALALRAEVILLDEMDLAGLARLPADADPELEQAARALRHLAAPSELRAAIVNAARKYGRQIVYQPGPSSFVCPVDAAHQIGERDRRQLHFDCRDCSVRARKLVMWDQDVANCLVRVRRWRASGPQAPTAAGPLAAD